MPFTGKLVCLSRKLTHVCRYGTLDYSCPTPVGSITDIEDENIVIAEVLVKFLD
jgi:hypothetical protein